jgi:hypothetical protein
MKNKKILGIKLPTLLIGTAILLVVTLIIRGSIKKRKRLIAECSSRGGNWDKDLKKCIVDQNATGVGGSQGGGLSWSPNNLAQEIDDNLEGYNLMVYPETAHKVLALNDEQLRTLYHYYNENHAKDYSTMTQLFYHEWDDTLWGKSTYDMVVDRLKAINLP